MTTPWERVVALGEALGLPRPLVTVRPNVWWVFYFAQEPRTWVCVSGEDEEIGVMVKDEDGLRFPNTFGPWVTEYLNSHGGGRPSHLPWGAP